jgi:hypothetical protein
MPTLVKILWLAGIIGIVLIFMSLRFEKYPGEIENIGLVSGVILSVECTEGSRSFMNKNIKISDSRENIIEFSMDGDCSKLKSEYSKFNKFTAYQIEVPIYGGFDTVFLKLDDVEVLSFSEEISDFNLSLFLSPLLVPLLLAFGGTINWLRGKWRG